MISTPPEVVEQTIASAHKKRATTYPKLFVSAMLAGAYIAFGGLLASVVAAGLGGIGATNPMIPRLVSGMLFPIGLIFVTLVGAELFTGNTATLMPAVLRRKVELSYLLTNWVIVFVGNVIGAVLFDYLIVYQSGVVSGEYHAEYLRSVAEAKVALGWSEAFVRGIGANWLVCLAVWLGLSSKTMLGRMVGLWWPIMAFVTIGFEHSIANMYFIPTGMMLGAEVSVAELLLDNLLPSTLGNIVGGALLVGTLYAWLTYTQKGQPNT